MLRFAPVTLTEGAAHGKFYLLIMTRAETLSLCFFSLAPCKSWHSKSWQLTGFLVHSTYISWMLSAVVIVAVRSSSITLMENQFSSESLLSVLSDALKKTVQRCTSAQAFMSSGLTIKGLYIQRPVVSPSSLLKKLLLNLRLHCPILGTHLLRSSPTSTL